MSASMTVVNSLVPGREFWQGRRVFLTGHTGFKGSWLVAWLSGLGAEVSGYSLPPATDPNLFAILGGADLCRHVEGDVRDAAALADAMRAADPEIAIHMAAQPLVRLSYAEPSETFDVNVQGTVNFLEACRRQKGLRSVVVVTTDKCYENREWAWSYRESDPLGGLDPYSASKACAEIVTHSYRSSFFSPERYAEHGVAVASARAGNVFGGGDWSADRLVPDIVRAFSKGETVTIRNPGAVRPWQHVLEPLSGYLMLARAGIERGAETARAWNFGPADAQLVTVGDFVGLMVDAWGGGRFETPPQENAPHEANLLLLDSGLARRCLNWRPSFSLDQAIRATADWYRSCYDGTPAAQLAGLTNSQIAAFSANLAASANLALLPGGHRT
ncbi:CDP-glucose 4,6-dehydratase [Skermanella aerolata]|uniref:CDP-glucose 4,6-dehydratase n=1 Tax=Skermanella aerolata TaxID=393310 RepID=UPI003D243A9E